MQDLKKLILSLVSADEFLTGEQVFQLAQAVEPGEHKKGAVVNHLLHLYRAGFLEKGEAKGGGGRKVCAYRKKADGQVLRETNASTDCLDTEQLGPCVIHISGRMEDSELDHPFITSSGEIRDSAASKQKKSTTSRAKKSCDAELIELYSLSSSLLSRLSGNGIVSIFVNQQGLHLMVNGTSYSANNYNSLIEIVRALEALSQHRSE